MVLLLGDRYELQGKGRWRCVSGGFAGSGVGKCCVARTSATVVEKAECVQEFLQWPMGSPNTYKHWDTTGQP